MSINNRVIGGGIALITVLTVVSGIFIYTNSDGYKDSRVIGSVGNHTFFYRDLKAVLGQGVDKKYAKDCLLENELYSNIAGAKNTTVTEQEVSELVKNQTQLEHPYHEAYFRLCAHRDILAEKLKKVFNGQKSGQIVLVNFDQHIPFAGRDDNTNPPKDREARIAADRTYASDLVNKLHLAVSNGSMNISDAVAVEQNDSRIGLSAEPTTLHSGLFDTTITNTPLARIFAKAKVHDFLSKAKRGDISPVITISEPIDGTDHPKLAEAKFVFLKVETATSGQNVSFEDAVANQKKLGYKVVK